MKIKINRIKTGERIKRLREESGLALEEAAAKAGASVGDIARWEAGEALPDVEGLCTLAELFEVYPDEILIGESDAKPEAFETEGREP